MSKIYSILIFSLIVSLGHTIAGGADSPNVSIDLLKREQPKVEWDSKSTVASDFTCDGKADTATIGYENDKAVWIGVVPGREDKDKTKLITLSFGINNMDQASFCSTPVEIDVHPIHCEDEDIGRLPGCKEIKGCSGFSMVDNACDSFHFYWDSSQSKLVWWRR